MDIDELLADKKAAEATYTVWADPSAAARVNAARVRHAADGDDEALNEVLTQCRASAKVFHFRDIGRLAYEKLVAEHQPTAAQRSEYRQAQLDNGIPEYRLSTLGYNADTFPPALIAATCTDVDVTAEKAQAMWNSERFSQLELAEILATAQSVCVSAPKASLPEG